MSQAGAIDVGALINGRKIGGAQIAVIVWCVLLFLSDGYDFGVLGNIAPAVIADWHSSRAAFGFVVSIGVIGLLVGSLVLGPLADRIGRRKVIILSGFIFGAFTFASAFATNLQELAALRFLAGLGIGGTNPNIIAYVAETVPERRRAFSIAIALLGGFTGGIALGSYIISKLLVAYDWHVVLYVGGVIPIVTCLLLIAFLPDTAMQLAQRGENAKVAKLLTRFYPGTPFSPDAKYFISDGPPPKFPVGALFSKENLPATCTLWFGGIMNGIVIFFLGSWLPTLVHESGLSVSQGAQANALNQVGGIAGGLTVTPMLDRFGPISIVVPFLLAVPAIIVLGLTGHDASNIMIMALLVGVCVVGAQTGQGALQAIVYPTALRSTGAGWAIGIQRVGGIIAPSLFGVLIAREVPQPTLFMIAAIPELLAAIAYAVFAYSRRGKGRGWSASAPAATETA
jgi:AAHS family 4-hydroxybenzoate transporter-like MFS transporter